VFVSFFSVRYTAANVERRIPLLLPYLAELALASSVEKKKAMTMESTERKKDAVPNTHFLSYLCLALRPIKKKEEKKGQA
jgi:hypothetical protein